MLSHSPRVAVITPYHGENIQMLHACYQSVVSQSMQCIHVFVADGLPRRELDSWAVHHVKLPVCHNDIGSTPRLIGSYHAIGLGVQAVAFLDADNWYHPDHISQLFHVLERENASFASSSRMLCDLNGKILGKCPLINPTTFVDTNCMLFGSGAFHLLHNWALMPDYAHLIGDRVMLRSVISSNVKTVHLDIPSVFYRCGKSGLYELLGIPVPPGVSPRPDYEASFRRWVLDGNAPLV